MKKYLISSLAIVAVLGGSVSPALAEGGSGIRDFINRFRSERQDARQAIQTQIRDDVEQARGAFASKSQELRLKLEQKRDEDRRGRLTKFWGKAAERLQNIVKREESMSARIATLLAKFKTAGKDVSKQEALLKDADSAIATARTSLDGAIATLKSMADQQKPVADIIAKARELHVDVIAKIRTAHKALIDVIVSLRGLSPVPSASVSPTATP